MFTLFGLIKALLPRSPSQEERDEAYLAPAVANDELERRMREVDARDRAAYLAGGFGTGVR